MTNFTGKFVKEKDENIEEYFKVLGEYIDHVNSESASFTFRRSLYSKKNDGQFFTDTRSKCR